VNAWNGHRSCNDTERASTDRPTSTITFELSDRLVGNLYRFGLVGMALGFVLLLVDRTRGMDLQQAVGLAAIVGSSAALVTSIVGRPRAEDRRRG
jgi:hypothetical protein